MTSNKPRSIPRSRIGTVMAETSQPRSDNRERYGLSSFDQQFSIDNQENAQQTCRLVDQDHRGRPRGRIA